MYFILYSSQYIKFNAYARYMIIHILLIYVMYIISLNKYKSNKKIIINLIIMLYIYYFKLFIHVD